MLDRKMDNVLPASESASTPVSAPIDALGAESAAATSSGAAEAAAATFSEAAEAAAADAVATSSD